MILTKGEKRFIKANQEILAAIFRKRIEELEKLASAIDPNLTAEEFKIKYLGYRNFINEMREWLREINILQKEKEEKKDNFV